jgi:hypothetical protein
MGAGRRQRGSLAGGMTAAPGPGAEAAALAAARRLLRDSLDLPALADRVGDDDDLVGRGVNSGEVVRLALHCEERLSRALTDDELAGLSSIRAVARLLQAPAVAKGVA